MIRRIALVMAAASLFEGAPAAADPAGARTIAALKARIAETRLKIDRVNAYDAVENLQNIYGYYIDKNLWDQVADLFARDSTMEMAQRGVYVGQANVRRFHAADPQGPVTNRLGDHLELQPVIHVSPDGQSAKVRLRYLQMIGFAGGRATLGGALYENEAVKEDGVWKIKTLRTYNTFVASYDGGLLHGANPDLPGPSKTAPPDQPPSLVFQAFPKAVEFPVHYRNPVTGR